MSTRLFHPAAEVFPMMPADALQRLAADIKSNGLKEKIVRTRDGLILDGRNRFEACRLADVDPLYEQWRGKLGEELAFVLSMNVHRRQLNESQRALAAANAMPLILANNAAGSRGEANLPQGERGENAGRQPQTRDFAAELFNVSARLVQCAVRIQRSSYLRKMVEDGSVRVTRAASLAGRTEAEQKRILERPRPGRQSRRFGNVPGQFVDLTGRADLNQLIRRRPNFGRDPEVKVLLPSNRIGDAVRLFRAWRIPITDILADNGGFQPGRVMLIGGPLRDSSSVQETVRLLDLRDPDIDPPLLPPPARTSGTAGGRSADTASIDAGDLI